MNKIGFIYLVEYVGSEILLQGKKYIGSKHYNKGSDWRCYLGSPTSTKDETVRLWRKLIKTSSEDFKRTILREVCISEKILDVERQMMIEHGVTTNSQSCWINRGIPSHRNFNTEEAKQKRINTSLERYGVDHISKTPERKLKFSEIMHTPERRVKRGKSISITLNSFTPEKWKHITNKRKVKFSQWASANAENISRRLKLSIPQHYVTLYCCKTDITESHFIQEWGNILGIGTGTIQKRIRKVTESPIISSLGYQYIFVSSQKLRPKAILLG